MRTASRVFRSIGLFGLVACLVFAAASKLRSATLEGPFILAVFFLACLFLSVLLGAQGAVELDGLTLPGADAHEDEEIHLPGPSWYPAAYGVSGLLVMLGLVMGHGVLIAGIVAIVLTTIGWGVESVHDYRREVAHAKAAVAMPPPAAIDLAHEVLAFSREHGGADSVVQHVGRGAAQVVLVGADGAWGALVARDVATGRTACALAGTTSHERWPAGLGARVRTGEAQWREMGGENAFSAAGSHEAPRDGSTQTASKVFLGLATFAFLIDLLYSTTSRFRLANLEGTAILTAFALACFYLHLGLKNAKARPEDAVYAGEDHVTIEPTVPDPPVDLETLHLPGPSWWPAFFSVALGLLVFGLVFSKTLLLVGIAGLVLCCIGWGIESVHDYRRQISAHH